MTSKISQIYCLVNLLIEEKGIGWRLAIDHSKKKFPVVIGGECISVQLSLVEWASLAKLIFDLREKFQEYTNNFSSDEAFILESERDSWWSCFEGANDSWSLKIRFAGDGLGERGFEMYWPIPSAQDFVSAMRIMWDSYQ